MIFPLPELGITLLLLGGFAAVGETVLWRRSRDIFSWNESFVVGMGFLGAALFPLSLLRSRDTLGLVLGLMSVALVIRVGRLWFTRQDVLTAPSANLGIARPDWIARGLLTGIVLIALVFCALNFRYSYLWDGFQVWATKAELLYYRGTLGREWFLGEEYDARLLGYPLLVPLCEALLARARGGFDFDVLKPIFAPFFISMLISTYAAARAVLRQRLALAATLLVAAAPALSTRSNAGGYADMPLAALVAAVVAAALRKESTSRGWRHPLPWLIGSLTTVKAEGTLLAAIACATVALTWLLEDWRGLGRRLRAQWSGVLVVAAFIGLRLGYLKWLDIHDTTYGPLDAAHIARALRFVWPLAKLTLRFMLAPATWGLFWPAFFLAAVALLMRGEPREVGLSVAVLFGIGIYSAIFLFTNWDLALHVEQAYTRLLSHLTPAAGVVILAGWERLRPRPGPGLSDLPNSTPPSS